MTLHNIHTILHVVTVMENGFLNILNIQAVNTYSNTPQTLALFIVEGEG